MTWLFSLIWIALLVCFGLGVLLSTVWWMWRRRAINAEYEKRRLAAEAESDRLRLRVSSLKLSEARADDLQLDLEKARTDSTRLPELEKELKELRLRIGLVSELENQIINLRTRADQADRLERKLIDLENQLSATPTSSSEPVVVREEIETASVLVDDRAGSEDSEDSETANTSVDDKARSEDSEEISIIEVSHEDDLKVIKGIGPSMEAKLNGMGIKSWEQLAALSEDEVKVVGTVIAVFPDRIKRDSWVSQAAEFVERFPLSEPYDRPTKETLKKCN